MTSSAQLVDAYLAGLSEERRSALLQVMGVVRENLPDGVEEGMQYGMIGWYIPHSIYAHGYHCDPKQPLPFAALASQKGYMSLYLTCGYIDGGGWIKEEAARRGVKLDMGKSCLRFKKLEELPLDLVGEAIRRHSVDDFIASYEAGLPESVKKKRAKLS